MKSSKLVGTLLGTATVAAGAAIAAAHAKHKKTGKGNILLENYVPGNKFKHKSKVAPLSTAHMNDNPSEHDKVAYETEAVNKLIKKANATLSRQRSAEKPVKEIERFNDMSAFRLVDMKSAIDGNPDETYKLFKAIRYANDNLKDDLILAFNYIRYEHFTHEIDNKTHAVATVRKPSFVFSKPSFSAEHSNHKVYRDSWVVVSKIKVVKENNLNWVFYKTSYGWLPEEAIVLSQSAESQKYVKNAERKIGRSPFAFGNQFNTVEAFSDDDDEN